MNAQFYLALSLKIAMPNYSNCVLAEEEYSHFIVQSHESAVLLRYLSGIPNTTKLQ